MKQNYTLIIFLGLMLSGFFAQSQTRYIDDVFTSYTTKDTVYSTNISILRAPQGIIEPIDLAMKIYTPEGDDHTDRPIILVAHTGNFLPQYINGGIGGGMSDSVVVNTCKRLTAKGYVAAAFTYRQGWNPIAPDQDTRTGTLLQAAYRGIQDARTAVRFIRKSVAEEGNPYGVDPEKIGIWGIGTGGYVSLGAATLDDYEEVTLDKFLNSETLLPLADTVLLGNFYGTNQTQLNLPNHVGYSSDFALCVNVGGAMGDISWLDGKENEPAFIGYHATGDVFAPFADGPVIVPTTMQFVVNVSGTKTVIDSANAKGNNDVFASLLPEFDPLKDQVEAQKAKTINWSAEYSTEAGADNMYAFQTPVPIGSPWNWWDKPTLDAIIPQVNFVLGTDYSSDTLHLSGLLTNPNMSAELGNTYLDTMFLHFAPRACLALNLGCQVSGVQDLKPLEIGLKAFPNPVLTETTLQVNADESIQKVYLYNTEGKLVQAVTNINSNIYNLKRNDLPSGSYFARIFVEEGAVVKQLLFE
ncbi:T9SS type A sorting domain-containing protein [Portibacter lacus]|nr:T9SS type A sorting domain-containing protein [Portibacter lacus]